MPEAHRGRKGSRRRARRGQGLARHLKASLGIVEGAAGVGCVDCGTTEDLTVDHLIPTVAGTASRYGGYFPRCRSCNSKKATRLPDYVQDRLIG